MKPKTLLQINTRVNSGSTGRIAEEIGLTAMARGWKSYIAFGRDEQPSQSQKIRIGNDWTIRWHGLQTRLFDRHGLASIGPTKRLIREMEVIKPDVVQLHNLHGSYINYPLLFTYFKAEDIPVVWTFHDCWPITGHCVYFDFVGCEKWKTQCYACPQKHTHPSSYFLDRSRRNYTLKKALFTSLPNLTVVPVSNWLSGLVGASYLKEVPRQLIYNGIDTKRFQPKETTIFRKQHGLESAFLILGVANGWTQRKGLNDFVKLGDSLSDDYRIVLVGLNKEQATRLPGNFIPILRTESVEALADVYAACDVYVNPTYEDNFPTTNLEALACGTPVVTYKTGGSPEAIDEKTGIVVEKGDTNGLLNAIEEIHSKGKAYYRDACMERAGKRYSKEVRYEEYMQLYERVMREK